MITWISKIVCHQRVYSWHHALKSSLLSNHASSCLRWHHAEILVWVVNSSEKLVIYNSTISAHWSKRRVVTNRFILTNGEEGKVGIGIPDLPYSLPNATESKYMSFYIFLNSRKNVCETFCLKLCAEFSGVHPSQARSQRFDMGVGFVLLFSPKMEDLEHQGMGWGGIQVQIICVSSIVAHMSGKGNSPQKTPLK